VIALIDVAPTGLRPQQTPTISATADYASLENPPQTKLEDEPQEEESEEEEEEEEDPGDEDFVDNDIAEISPKGRFVRFNEELG
jgi:hypothetical protein